MADNRSYGDERERMGPRSRTQMRRPPRGANAQLLPRRPVVCPFCVDKNKVIDYKQVDVLHRYITERGQIRARRKSGLCAKHQRRMSEAIKRARFMALLPYTSEHIRLHGS